MFRGVRHAAVVDVGFPVALEAMLFLWNFVGGCDKLYVVVSNIAGRRKQEPFV